jgi:cobalt/nickel transport system permease protein
MHFHFLDNYSQLDSPIHRLPAWVKMFVAVGIVAACVLTPLHHVVFFGCVGLLLFLIAAASLIPGAFLIKRVLLLEPIVLGVAVLSLLQPNGGWIFLGLVARSSLCIVSLTLLANTTPLGEMLRVMQQLKLPAILITTVALMHRYLFVLLEESQRMRRARASRTFRKSQRSAWTSLATVAAQLFVRSTDRAERVYAAMCARGWK